MKKSMFRFLGLAALITALVAFAIGQSAAKGYRFGMQESGPHPPPPPPNLDHMAQELNLSDAQKSQIKAILDAVHSTMASSHTKFADLHKQLETATANGNFDEAQVRAIANQQAQLTADLMVEHERAKSKIYNLLTAEQRIKFEELHKHHGPGGEFGPGMPPPPPPPPASAPSG